MRFAFYLGQKAVQTRAELAQANSCGILRVQHSPSLLQANDLYESRPLLQLEIESYSTLYGVIRTLLVFHAFIYFFRRKEQTIRLERQPAHLWSQSCFLLTQVREQF